MPKMKTNRAAAKRFWVTKKGKVKKSCANKSHILTSKNKKRKRKLRGGNYVSKSDVRSIQRMLPSSF